MTRIESMQRSLVVLGCLASVAYFAIWACAPVHHMRPPVPVAQSGESEFGFAVGADTRKSESRVFQRGPLTAMSWWQGVFFDGSMRFGAGLSYDGELPGGSLYLGARLHETPSSYVWLDGGLNLPGADVSLSMGLALTDEIWLYTAPGLTVWVFPVGEQAVEVTVAYRLPIGLAYWSPGGDVSLRLEAGLLNQGLVEESQVFAGIGIAMPIGVKSSKD